MWRTCRECRNAECRNWAKPLGFCVIARRPKVDRGREPLRCRWQIKQRRSGCSGRWGTKVERPRTSTGYRKRKSVPPAAQRAAQSYALQEFTDCHVDLRSPRNDRLIRKSLPNSGIRGATRPPPGAETGRGASGSGRWGTKVERPRTSTGHRNRNSAFGISPAGAHKVLPYIFYRQCP